MNSLFCCSHNARIHTKCSAKRVDNPKKYMCRLCDVYARNFGTNRFTDGFARNLKFAILSYFVSV